MSFLQPSTGLQTFTLILEKLIIKQKLSANSKGGVAIQYFIPQETIKYDRNIASQLIDSK